MAKKFLIPIQSTVSTGTAPFTIASTTAVTNLNADLLDGQHGSYYAPLASPTFTGTVTIPILNLTTAATSSTATSYWVETGSDGIIRPKTLANVKTEIVTTAAVNSAAATTVLLLLLQELLLLLQPPQELIPRKLLLLHL